MLAWTIYLSFIGAGVVTLTPGKSAVVARLTALLTTVAGLVIAIAAIAHAIRADDHHCESAVDAAAGD